MPKAIIKVNLDINNIGPHYGINKISFPGKLNSNKVIFYIMPPIVKTR
jgi:hypothetical protein